MSAEAWFSAPGISQRAVVEAIAELDEAGRTVVVTGRATVVDQLLDQVFDSPRWQVDFAPEADPDQLRRGHLGWFRGAAIKKTTDPRVPLNELWVEGSGRRLVLRDVSIVPR